MKGIMELTDGQVTLAGREEPYHESGGEDLGLTTLSPLAIKNPVNVDTAVPRECYSGIKIILSYYLSLKGILKIHLT